MKCIHNFQNLYKPVKQGYTILSCLSRYQIDMRVGFRKSLKVLIKDNGTIVNISFTRWDGDILTAGPLNDKRSFRLFLK